MKAIEQYSGDSQDYLDKDDIEKNSWLFDIDATSKTSRYKYKDYILLYNSENNRIRIKKDVSIFDGTIKNYNELQTLMKQLNIIE